MSNKLVVSVIIPMYNAEKYIFETMQSVLSQTYQDWEMIVVDNCSTDKSIQVVEEFEDKRIRLIKLDYNSGGPARPRNIGVENSMGNYIAFLDADDLWTPNKLQIQLSTMIDNNLNFSSTSMININEYSVNTSSGFKFLNLIKKNRKKNTICDLIKYRFIATSSVIVDKKLLSTFSENTDYISVEDFCLWLEILKNPEVKYKYLDDKLLKYRVSIDSASDRSNIYKQISKANMCILIFIIRNNYYKVINCFYKSIVREIIVNCIKKCLMRIN